MECDFIEIGTSNFDTLIQSCEDQTVGISVEPLINYLEDLPDRPHVIKFNAAISNQAGELDMYYVPPEDVDKHFPGGYRLKGCNSLGKPHPTVVSTLKQRSLEHLIQTRKVPVITFQDLIEKFNIQSIGYLKIDTEGHDCVILKSMLECFQDLPKDSPLWPDKIKFETNILTSRDQIVEMLYLLKQKNYLVRCQTPDDTVLVRMIQPEVQTVRILCLSYDLTNPGKWECGRRLLNILDQLENVQHDQINLDIRTCGHKVDVASASKWFDSGAKPDLILAQQFSIPQGRILSQALNVPFILLLHNNVGEYSQFYPKENEEPNQPNLILCWNDELEKGISSRVSVPTLSLNSNWLNFDSKFWDLIHRKISIVVPCHGEHIYMLDNVLQNFNNFVSKPYEIVISVSLAPGQSSSEVSEILSRLKNKYPLSLKFHLSWNPLTASQNRNLGAYQSTGDILIFLDVDDTYHPQLTEIVKYFWKNHDIRALNWEFISPNESEGFHRTKYELDQIKFMSGDEIFKVHHGNRKYFDAKWDETIPNTRMTHGHLALSKQTWSETPWPDIIGAEDSGLHLQLDWKYPRQVMRLRCPLSIYQYENSIGLT